MITADLLKTLVPTLDRTQFAVLLKSVLGIRTPEQEEKIDLKEQIQAGLWEFMWSLGFVSDAQARCILTRTDATVAKFVTYYTLNLNNASLPLPRLAIAFIDRRWLVWNDPSRWPTWNDHKTWYDMLYDQDVNDLPEPPIMTITCDVTALYKRQMVWLARHRSKDAEPQHHAGSDEQGDKAGHAGQGESPAHQS